MEFIKKKEIMQNAVILPETSGVVYFYKADKLLYCRMTGNINKALQRLLANIGENQNLEEMLEKCDKIGFLSTDNIFSALIQEKSCKFENRPEYNRIYRDYDQYQYLGLNFIRFPFITVRNDTLKDFFYLGPFRDIYLVRDSIDILSRVFGCPVCSESEAPCYLLESGNCKGYCIQNQDYLGPDLVRYYLLPEKNDLQVVEEMKQSLSTKLMFREADELSNYQRILQRFYSRITFLSVTKRLNMEFKYNNRRIKIKNGLLNSDGTNDYFVPAGEYQPNEQYSVDKSELDERWVLFNHVKNRFPDKLIEAYDLNRKQLTDYLSKREKESNERSD